MPGQFLTHSQRRRLNEFPSEMSTDDLITFFTLTSSDLEVIPNKKFGDQPSGLFPSAMYASLHGGLPRQS